MFWNGADLIDQDDGALADGLMHTFLFLSRNATDHELYIDGQSIGTSTTSKSIGSATDNELTFGSWRDSQFFNGKLKAVYIWEGTYPTPAGVSQLAEDPLGLVRLKEQVVGKEVVVVAGAFTPRVMVY